LSVDEEVMEISGHWVRLLYRLGRSVEHEGWDFPAALKESETHHGVQVARAVRHLVPVQSRQDLKQQQEF
jgi:hypothetical protein